MEAESVVLEATPVEVEQSKCVLGHDKVGVDPDRGGVEHQHCALDLTECEVDHDPVGADLDLVGLELTK